MRVVPLDLNEVYAQVFIFHFPFVIFFIGHCSSE